jgi:hypothetical protein
MAKLTELEKAANKAAQKIRDKAYHARSKAHRDARDAVESRVNAGPEAAAADAARKDLDAAVQARNDEQKAITAEIEKLKERILAVGRDAEQPINAAKAARDAAWSAKQELSKAALAQVDAEFADVAEVHFVGAWPVPQAVQAQMDAAAASVRAAWDDSAGA